MSDLIEFLQARLDDDEAVAREASAQPGVWVAARHPEMPLVAVHVVRDDEQQTEVAFDVERAEGVHIARWDPTRVLAEIEAKRTILDLARESAGLESGLDFELGRGCGPRDEDDPYVGDRILRALAQPYVDHPDFDLAWRTA